MTPQELLDLAAYAIGLRGKQLADGTIAYSEFGRFNPLTNKADAFELMVKLGMSVDVEEDNGTTYVYIGKVPRMYVTEKSSTAPEAAAMLAITRAAAAIGKQMKGEQNAE